MKANTFIAASALAAAFVGQALAAEPWEDPAVNAINRLPARAISIPCHVEQLAFDILQGKADKSASRWIIPLAGEWDFKWKSSTAVADWEKTAKLMVPGCWQLQGDFDPPLYTNVKYPIALDAPRVTKEPDDKSWTAFKYRNPVGLYTTTFKRPWRWWFRRTVIHFDGVSSAFKVRVNGKDVGYSEDSRLPAEFDLTDALNVFGENTLEVEVYKHSDGSYLEDQDFWRLSGIFRDVYLVSENKGAPFDLVAETTLADDMKSGKFVIRDEKGAELKVRDVPEVRLWSSETPFVYMTPIEHHWGLWSTCSWSWWPFGGIDYRAVTFGFRKIEIRDSVLYLNGRRVLFKGANRHEMEPATGYAVTREGMKKDIETLKAFNVNAVRTCHYPDTPEWYDLCDREGLMVVCEANVESHGYDIYHGTNSLSFRKDYERAHVERGTRMVETFRNHPSIILWSMGNESGYGPNFKAEYKAMKAIDPTRPIQYENFCRARIGKLDKAKNGMTGDEESYTDTENPMYCHPWEVEKYVANKPAKPYFHCEYSHAMGNSNGGIQEYWDLAKKYPSYQGGFIWDFADQALWKTDAHGKWLAYGGDFGDRPNDDNFNCNGFFDALRNPHPGAYEIKHAYQNIRCEAFDFATGTVTIRNGYMFRTLEDAYCSWKSLNADGTPAAKGTFEPGEVQPGETVRVKLEGFKGDSVTFVFSEDLDGMACDYFSKPYRAPVRLAPQPSTPNLQPSTFNLQPSTFNPPLSTLKLNFWRAPTDNDRGWQMSKVCKVWKDATDTQKLPAGVKSDLKTTALVDGSTRVDWTLTVPKGLPPIPRVGLTFTLPKAETVTWFGLGPHENYADRATSAMLDVYTASVGLATGLAASPTGTIAYAKNRLNPDNYVEPGEQGYRTGCRRLTVGDFEIVAGDAPFGFNVWPYPQTMLEGKKHQWELREADELTVNVDAVQMGVGGDNSWGARPHDPYMPGAGTYRLSFVIRNAKEAAAAAPPRPAPSPVLAARLKSGFEIWGIVHWGLNTFTDSEWGYGDEDPKLLDPDAFDADQIAGACRDGGLQGLVIVAKHHDGFCLWPTKTTEHNVSRSPFRGGEGDYVREMCEACRRAGLRFGVYVSPWDRNNADYASEKYVETYHKQIEELLGGDYGEVFEMWFDGANGGDGYYGGKRETRRIPDGYYKFPELFPKLRGLQPGLCIFAGEHDTADFRWPGNERGEIDPDSRATICPVGGFANGKYGNPDYKTYINRGCADGTVFKVCEADFPLRPGWFYHESEDGGVKSGEYLMNRYLSACGNAAGMNIGIAPDAHGRLHENDVKALKRFSEIRDAFFATRVDDPKDGFNVVVLRENVERGERIDGWEFKVDGKTVFAGRSVGLKRIRCSETLLKGAAAELLVTKCAGAPEGVTVELYRVDPALLKTVLGAKPPVCRRTSRQKAVCTSNADGVMDWRLAKAEEFSSVTFVPNAADPSGTPVEFTLAFAGDDGKWSEPTPVMRLGNVAANPVPQTLKLGKTAKARYVRVTVMSVLKTGAIPQFKGLSVAK